MDGVSAEDRVFAVERALMLLQCFERADETRTLASLAKQSGLYKSTILRLTSSMCKMGFLARRPSGLFALGPELTRLASLGRISIDIGRCMRSELRKLAGDTEESASFYIRRGRYRICLFRETGQGDSQHPTGEGTRIPLNGGAVAQVLRAYGRCAKDPDLASVRRQGWAVSRGDKSGLAAIAIPVFNRDKELLGALALTTPPRRFTGDREQFLRHAAVTAAQALTAAMRFVHPNDLSDYLAPWSPDAAHDRCQSEAQAQCA